MISDMLACASKAKPTRFHHLLDDLAQARRLRSHYTQNIDCLEDKLPSLPRKTVQLHGRLDTLVCQKRSIHTLRVTPEDFQQRIISPCPECEEADKERVESGKRSNGVGVLLPKILLYRAGPDESTIEENDLRQTVDAVIIAGTALKTPAMKKFPAELCHSARGNWRWHHFVGQ
jgi:NAD+-dependent protein deacetylase SIR2